VTTVKNPSKHKGHQKPKSLSGVGPYIAIGGSAVSHRYRLAKGFQGCLKRRGGVGSPDQAFWSCGPTKVVTGFSFLVAK
jgi:hypothetical protein